MGYTKCKIYAQGGKNGIIYDSKKREQIGDEIDDLLMSQYHHRCKVEEAKRARDKKRFVYEMKKIEEAEEQIKKLRKKLG